MAEQRSIQLQEAVAAADAAEDNFELADALQTIKLLLQEHTVPTPEGLVERLFMYLGHETADIVELACSCIAIVLRPMDYYQIAERYQEYLAIGLQLTNSSVRALTLAQVRKCLVSTATIERFLSARGLLGLMVESLTDKSAQYVERASLFLDELAKHPAALNALFAPEIVEIYVRLSNSSDVHRMRLWHLLTSLGVQFQSAFAQFNESGLLQRLLDDVSSDDPLVAMNAVDLVSRLSEVDYALAYLGEAGVIRAITKWALPDAEATADRVTVCAALKFLGRLGQSHDVQVLHERFNIVSVVASQIQSSDVIIKSTAIRTLGVLGHRCSGLEVIRENGLFSTLAELAVCSLGDLRIPCLEAIVTMLNISETQDAVKSQLCEQLYCALDAAAVAHQTTFIALVLSHCRQAFEELRFAGYGVLQALVSYAWGRQLLARNAAFMKQILDRNTEPSYEGAKWKYSIIRGLAEAPDIENFANQATVEHLRSYVREGAFFKGTIAAVAMESAS